MRVNALGDLLYRQRTSEELIDRAQLGHNVQQMRQPQAILKVQHASLRSIQTQILVGGNIRGHLRLRR
ncbi:hypothetical protein CDO52_26490 [Nocardiopsis gilva YIM 90087]|uniref:Uncharacterized protein n=1 Tax=Nocardiopsis gilva YIM 90087 TaxID=1235441 RepID=A0A223SCR5_9ACTN|nr:hypothetical protein [Nocardiopsis gilva]ASU85876.1 hypothetical protein CDO52_26490 [Nocardiopsis gilva YIM 90087]